jgi:tetratricopeptide (TPR) repeat protein
MNNSQVLTATLNKVLEAEHKGLYEQAFTFLSPFWNTTSQFPITTGLSSEESAELFLRCGGVIGFLGNSRQITNAQEISKDILTEARHQFLLIYDYEKVAECENYLALAYWRTGEFVEADDWLRESFSRNLPPEHHVRLYSYVIEGLINLDKKKYEEIIVKSENQEDAFEKYANDLLNGCFHNQIGIAYKNLGMKYSALKHLKEARAFFQQAEHRVYCGVTENNLAQFFHSEGNFTEAHNSANNARKIFELLGDKTREGFSLETIAQIYCAEQKFEKALKYINDAIELLEKGESYLNLVESYRTKVKILIQLNQISDALTVMTAAHNLAALHIAQELAREIIEDTAALIQEKLGQKVKNE